MKHVSVIVFCAWFVACASPPPAKPTAPPPAGEVVLLPPVAEMTLVTAAGLRELRADWSQKAELNLAQALADTVPEMSLETSDTSRATAHRLASLISTGDGEAQMPLEHSGRPDGSADFIGLILLQYDIESSASRLLQGGLGIMFGGVPGPDGIERSARFILFDRASGEPVWSRETEGRDARNPDAANRLIIELIRELGLDTES